MSIFQPKKLSQAETIYENILAKAPNQKLGEENRCLSAFQDLWGQGELVDIPNTEYRTVANPISASVAQEVLALLGTEAGKIFASHSSWQNSIMIINSEWKKLVPPYPISFNKDGSAQINEG